MRNEDMDIGFDRYMTMNNGNYREHYSEESIDNMKTDFFAGAEWRINSVWHDASEMPEKKFALVEYDCFPKGMDTWLSPMHGKLLKASHVGHTLKT